MRITFALLGLLLCATASAGPIDSSASGIYVGGNRVCRMVFSADATHTRADMICVGFNGSLTSTLPVFYTFGAPCAISGAFQTSSASQAEFISLRDFSGTALSVVLGSNATAVSNGIGVPESWQRVATIPSPAPYSCGQPVPQPRYPRLCREFGLYCGT